MKDKKQKQTAVGEKIKCSMCDNKAEFQCTECDDLFCKSCRVHDCFHGRYWLEKLDQPANER